MKNLNGLIIRYDHDDLLILLERFKIKNVTIINFDRHHDADKNKSVDIGSWIYYGKLHGTIGNVIWIPPLKNFNDIIRRTINFWRIKFIKSPVIISICYDYLIGSDVGHTTDKIKKAVAEITKIMHFVSVSFIFCARSPQYVDLNYLEWTDNYILQHFKNTFPLSKYSQTLIPKR